MISSFRSILLGGILLAYLIAGLLYATLTPPWQAPDEPAHYNYIRYLATKTGFPELVAACYNQAYLDQLTSRRFPPELSVESVCYEFHQPPLYYLLAAPLFVVSDGALLALRLLSVTFGAATLMVAYLIGVTIFPNRPAIAYGTMAFTAFTPMHVAMLSAVNNDALAELILVLLLLLLVHRFRPNSAVSLKDDLLLGFILGLGLLTKTTVYIVAPLIAAALWLAHRGNQKTRFFQKNGFLLKPALTIYGLALLIALPWYIRNLVLYGGFDILGLKRHNEIVVGQLRTADFVAEVGLISYLRAFITTTFQSFWGQFGWMAVPMDRRTYLLLALLTLLALAGLIAWGIKTLKSRIGHPQMQTRELLGQVEPVASLSTSQWRALNLMALTVLLMALGYGWYNLTFVQFQGRYLFPSLIPLGLFFSLGLTEILRPDRTWLLAAGLFSGLIWVAATTILNGGLDKWASLIIGLALALVVGRLWLRPAWAASPAWLLALCYAGLAFLTLAGPFWFIIPYL